MSEDKKIPTMAAARKAILVMADGTEISPTSPLPTQMTAEIVISSVNFGVEEGTILD